MQFSRAGEELQPAVLQPVRVLELVDEDVPEAVAVMLAQRLVARQELVGAQQELREIDHAFALALLVVRGVDLDHAPRHFVVGLDVLRAPPFLLVRRDEPGRLPRRIALLVEVHAFHEALDDRELVLRVEDLKKMRQPGLAVVRAQHAVAQAVKSADPHAARVDRQHRRDAREHLLGGLVGESHRQEPVRAHLPGLYQPRDARRQHARFAAAGAGEYQRRLVRQRDRFELLFVQTGKELGRHAMRREKTRSL